MAIEWGGGGGVSEDLSIYNTHGQKKQNKGFLYGLTDPNFTHSEQWKFGLDFQADKKKWIFAQGWFF